MTPDIERKAQERQRRKEAGLVRLELWVRPEQRAAIIAFAQRLDASPKPVV